MSVALEVKFDQSNGVYYSGQIVSGTVKINFNKPYKVRGISITIRGYSKSEWNDEKKKKKKSGGRPEYTGTEEHIAMTTYLVQSEDENPIDISPGVHPFVFKCRLPKDIPPSFEGTYGHTRYFAKVVIERPWRAKQSYETEFTVMKSVDLNRECPSSKTPVEVENMKTLGCGLCRTAPLILRIRLPQSGYVPGQIIPINTELISTGSVEVLEVRFYLRRITSYRVDKPMPSFKEEVVELFHKSSGNLQSNSSCSFQENLEVPLVSPTTLLHSKIIDIGYDVKVEAVLGVVNRTDNSLVVLCPITVGTESLVGDAAEPIVPILSVRQTEPTEIQEAGPNIPPPPSYEESMELVRIDADNDERKRQILPD